VNSGRKHRGVTLLQLPVDSLSLTTWLLLVFFILLIITISYNIFREWGRIPGESQWIATKGKILSSKAEFKAGIQLSVTPRDPRIHRLDLGSYSIWYPYNRRTKASFFRMRLHLTLDTGIHFELTPKAHVPGGIVFDPTEAMIGNDVIDQLFYTETTTPKETSTLLENPKLLTLIEETPELRKLQVKGDLIELIFVRKVKLIEPLYQLALTLAYQLEELYL
jgi:hypothetical protein